MSKKTLLYFKNISMHKENLSYLKKNFNVIETNNFDTSNKLDTLKKKKISLIYCDPSNYYSASYLKKF